MNPTLKRFGYPDTTIKEFEHWTIVLRPNQITVGTLVLINKSEALHLGDLAAEVWAGFAQVSAEAERLTRAAFGAEKFNYLALMMRDPNPHFHFVPRYSQPVKVLDQEFKDPDWPLRTQFNEQKMAPEIWNEVKRRLMALL